MILLSGKTIYEYNNIHQSVNHINNIKFQLIKVIPETCKFRKLKFMNMYSYILNTYECI